eukprot:TRINITY_DN764_c0_g1_i2.p1 TRINITY_DN764_c0_g1~~TRINITY_DN764_c0_g1_i2.p1  ORF type:complete len:723 (-),score=165.56 TRINITY_DN764_c0_g1_i2:129-2297(-)
MHMCFYSTRVGPSCTPSPLHSLSYRSPGLPILHVAATVELFIKDTMNAGDNINDEFLVRTLCTESTDAIAWLSKYGVRLDTVSQCGGHSAARTHRASPGEDGRPVPIGFHIITQLRLEAEQRERIEILTSCTVTAIMRGDEGNNSLTPAMAANKVAGPVNKVIYTDGEGKSHELLCDSVVLTTGGYAAAGKGEGSLLLQHAPDTAALATTNGPWAVGEGIRLAQKRNIQVRDLDKVQVHPTGFVAPDDPTAPAKILAPEACRGHGGLLINAQGKRFTNELGRRDHVTRDIFAHCSGANGVRPWVSADNNKADDLKCAALLLNKDAVEAFGSGAIGFYKFKGLLKEFASLAEVSEYLKVPAGNLESEIEAYVQGGKDNSDAHGKTTFPSHEGWEHGPYTVGIITPSVHYTMGGIIINAATQVQKTAGKSAITKPVTGVFAAGEITGGVHGANRLAGNSLLECVVFGRIAGHRASTAKEIYTACLTADTWTPLKFTEVQHLSDNMKLVRFALQSAGQRTGLGIGQYIAVRATVQGSEMIRYYSPISRPDAYGHIDLLIKVDNKGGDMSHHLTSLKPGDEVDFRGPLGGIDLSTEKVQKIGMIAGGSGISPMIQIIRSVFDRQDTKTQLNLMYGAVKEDDFVYHQRLQESMKERDNFDVTFFLNEPPEGWTGGVGFINAEAIKKTMFPPGKGVKVIICGPPAMCKAMKAALKECGYTDDMVYSYM